MVIKIDDVYHKDFSKDNYSFIKFLKENTHSGKVSPKVEVFKTVDIEKDSFQWVMSTFDTDRDRERVDPKGWLLKNYIANPVVLWSHIYEIPPIGYAENVHSDKELQGLLNFNDREYDEFGWSIGQRVKHGVLRCGSAGFLAYEVEFLENKDRECDLIFRKQELLEFSICAVPSNPFALNSDMKDIGMKELFKKEASFYDRLRSGMARA